MKALLLLSVLLSGVLAITAAAVEAPEAVKVVEAPEAATVVEAPEAVEAAPQELQENNQNEDPQMVSTGEITLAGRFSSCPSGWQRYSDACYKVQTSRKPWSDAASHCSAQRAILASAHDPFEYNFLQLLTNQERATDAWLGGFYFQNRWRWADLSPFYDFSTTNPPSSCPCIYLSTTADMYNSYCSSAKPFICMRKIDSC